MAMRPSASNRGGDSTALALVNGRAYVSRETRWALANERTQRERPRQGNRRRIETHAVVARLVVERSSDDHRLLAAQRRLGVGMSFEDELLNERERFLVYRHALLERLEHIDRRLRIL